MINKQQIISAWEKYMKWPYFDKNKITKDKLKVSETSKVRDTLSKFCAGDGIDIGFGGDPIRPSSICIDLHKPYARYNYFTQHLHGDGRVLRWFCDNTLDYVYSSHLLEDFEDVAAVLKEWLRVLKPGGRLVLFLPDERVYREYCHSQGKPTNSHHRNENFSLNSIKELITENRLNVEIEHEAFPVAIYSFEIVLRKTS
jgi:predicted SAM-dependent methyltransferase